MITKKLSLRELHSHHSNREFLWLAFLTKQVKSSAVRNTTVGLEHVETPADMKMWPQFHNGVATGLRIAHGISQV